MWARDGNGDVFILILADSMLHGQNYTFLAHTKIRKFDHHKLHILNISI